MFRPDITAMFDWGQNTKLLTPLKERLNYNKGILMHKIMSGKVPPSLTAKPSLNHHDILESSIYQSLGLTFSNLALYILAVYFRTQSLTLLDYHPPLKRLNHMLYIMR